MGANSHEAFQHGQHWLESRLGKPYPCYVNIPYVIMEPPAACTVPYEQLEPVSVSYPIIHSEQL